MKSMKIGMLAAAVAAAAALGSQAAEEKPKSRPDVEVVFAIDTTGSMGGLIEAAKQKVWSIANEVAKGKPAPRIKLGLVAYRDRGDSYVTQVFDLSDNLDKVYKDLLAFKADGGGDFPEHVLKALDDSAEKISWSSDPKTLKVLYLVGDAPPHTEYGDTPPMEKILQKLVKKGVILNSIQCGREPQTAEAWQKMARLGEGKFLAIAQDGGVAAVATPFDARLAEASRRLDGTMLAYGSRKAEAVRGMALSREVAAAAPASAVADRAVFKAKAGFDGTLDLAQAVEEKKVDASKLKDAELPDALRGLSAEERTARIDEAIKQRHEIQNEIDELNVKRANYLKEASAKSPKDSFDAQVARTLREQAALKGIRY